MKSLKGNNFLYFGDKNVSKVSGIWKALHISIYVAVAINAFITAMAAGNMFQTFKYNCILYCTDIGFEKEIVKDSPLVHTISSRDVSLSESDELMTQNGTNLDEENVAFNDYNEYNGTDFNNITQFFKNNASPNNETDSVQTEVPKRDLILFKNKTHILMKEEDSTLAMTLAKINLRKTQFSSNFWCNYVLGIALVTFIFASFCTVILAMCSKGGKGQNNTLNRPQNMIYPILVSSIILGILNTTASVVVKNGMQAFCAQFELFTEEKSCSSSINHFTIHERQQNFYLPYLVLSHTFNITVILFVGQMILTFMRVIYAVDYQLYVLQIEEQEETSGFEVEDGQIVKDR